MPPTPSQIKELLLSAIDKDENIVDMGSVTKAVSLLESNPITKDALEETRLGRLVQIVRKKATTSNLKKRCTALIKQWQSQFLPPSAVKPPRTESPVPHQEEVKGQEGSSTSDGQKPKPAKQTVNATSVDKSKSENLRRRKRQPENSPSISPSSQAPPSKKLISSSQGQSPLLQGEGNGQDDSGLNGMSSKRDVDCGRKLIKDSVKTASPKSSVPSPKSKPNINKDKGSLKKLKSERSASPKPKTKDSSLNSVSPALQPKAEKHLKPKGLSPSVAKAKSDKRVKVSPAPRVAIGKKRSSSHDRSPRPSNDSSASNSPAVVGGTSLKSTGTFSTDWDTAGFGFGDSGGESSRSATPQNVCDAPSSSKPFSIFDLDFTDAVSSQVSNTSLFDRSESPASFLDERPFTPTISAFSEEFSQRTEYNHSPSASKEEEDEAEEGEEEEEEEETSVNVMETLEDEPVTPPCPVLEGDIDRIHDDEWEGVNGCYNDKGEWFDWMQCLTVNTDVENSIQILPYVCID
ncbi:mediator of RNA polymerase II transcription subunit 26-like isoform X1 [Strongylocentrotus purpuratus]|uniref:TFIIS N-terminal domain-containing protein n=2 Tax=Strongylocentrotus purpuratus TaxID=7668 RepID=A0A7M7PLJ5_STRPU|nr:mediator of RNA polymerase II transcription subunit 26-like isoform X1 [Strongylocentrotus purpuratus]